MPTAPPLPPAVSGERVEFDSPAGRLSLYIAGAGPAMLLVHSVNAAASAAEVRPLHEHFRATHTVFSVDLPGYGFAAGSTRGLPWLYRALRGPRSLWGASLFRGLTRPGVVRYFLQRTWGAKVIDEALWRYCVLTARQAGAEHAPLAFLAAGLFSADIHAVYERLDLPVWMSHGVRGDFTDYRGKALVEARPNWRFSVFQGGALPYFELPERFCAAYADFLAAPQGTRGD